MVSRIMTSSGPKLLEMIRTSWSPATGEGNALQVPKKKTRPSKKSERRHGTQHLRCDGRRGRAPVFLALQNLILDSISGTMAKGGCKLWAHSKAVGPDVHPKGGPPALIGVFGLSHEQLLQSEGSTTTD
ncbi:BPM6 [Symbiodinium necroappetens]|uniref:BPM6 protein n=1 Tax=Symbiodinium necroappetens TaxID=1628268 RepID=A0A812RFA9_9DINO|nr:BPM6 [Symbiodinium necroappetens]